jgi:molybdopterin-synthase adenylyltransferase
VSGVRIVFCGVGALGSNAAMACRNLAATLRFIDFDRVESKNLLAQAYVKQSIGKHKATALKLQLANFHGIKAEASAVRLAATNTEALLHDGDLLVDAFDNLDSRRVLSDYARSASKPCVHAAIAADGSCGLVRWDEQFVPDAEDAPGQATCEGGEHLPTIMLVASTLARTVQEFVEQGRRINSIVTLSGVQRH